MPKEFPWEKLEDPKEGLEELLWEAKNEEQDIKQIRIRGQIVSGLDFSRLGFSEVLFENCRFLDCSFEKGTFHTVCFQNCDFSNSNFSWSYLKDCRWEGVKAIGIKAQKADFFRTAMYDCNLAYGNFGESKFEKWKVQDCDFTESFFTACRFKEVLLQKNRFIRTSFFETALRNLDFTSCQLESVFVSDDGKELTGATVDVYQAAEFAKLFGLKVV